MLTYFIHLFIYLFAQCVTQCEPDSKAKKRTLTAALSINNYYIKKF